MNYIALIFIIYSLVPTHHYYKEGNLDACLWVFIADIWAVAVFIHSLN